MRTNPKWVDAILGWRWTWPLARIGLTSAYLVGGLAKLFNFTGAVAEQTQFGIHPPALFAALTIVVELGGSALVLSGRWLWLGAGALAVFTAMATLIAHPFWAMIGQERVLATNAFFEHIGLIAGFAIAALFAAGEGRRIRARCERRQQATASLQSSEASHDQPRTLS